MRGKAWRVRWKCPPHAPCRAAIGRALHFCNNLPQPKARNPVERMGAEQSAWEDGHAYDSPSGRQGSPIHFRKPRSAIRTPSMSHRNGEGAQHSPGQSWTASYDSWSSAGSSMTKAGMSRAMVDEANLAQAQDERAAKFSRAQQWAEQQHTAWERGRARSIEAHEQRHATLEQVEAVRRHKAEQGREGREHSAHMDRVLAASDLADLEQKEDEAAAARERRWHALAAGRNEVHYNTINQADQVAAPAHTRRGVAGDGCTWSAGEGSAG